MWRHIVSNFLSVLIVILLAIGAGVAWGQKQFTGAGPLAEAVCFVVPQGTSFSRLAPQLAEQGVISSEYIFRAGLDYSGKAPQLKHGSYLIEPATSMETVIDQLTTAGASSCGAEVIYRIGVRDSDIVLRELDPATKAMTEIVKVSVDSDPMPAELTEALAAADLRLRVTVAEGVTSWQVVEGLNAFEHLQGDAGERPAEGSLAPGSYEIGSDLSRAGVIARMESVQAETLDRLWEARAEGLPYATKEEALVMASIVEKETGLAEERHQVAGVFVNRLKKGMRLQTDPAVIYGVTNGEGILERGLRASELKRATPYNTYVIEGLPPGPIANPGAAAIEAALHPDETEYLFFVADGTGGHAFATTLAEHNANVAKWRKIEAEQNAAQ
ncbi:endolytic transglycosylase MltG [Albirhodobacter sp. R86504]|uniref:endolytic transglycosylase MltG n=1 Tax=Albirhodobacter sp. R86504 TaxID=3093848 RepID=UPI00366DCA55